MALWGLLLGLGAPGYDCWVFPWLALIPALLWVQRQSGLKSVVQGGFCFGSAYVALYCLWFFDLHPVTWLGFSELESRLITLAGWLLLVLEGGLLGAGLLGLYKMLPTGWSRVLLFPFLWVLGFGLLNTTPFALPWPLVEYTQMSQASLRLLVGWISGSGLAILIILHNAFWAEFWQAAWLPKVSPKKPSFLQSLAHWFLPLGILCVPGVVMGLSFLPLDGNWASDRPSNQPWPLSVAVIQANLPIEVVRSSVLSQQATRPAYIYPLRDLAIPSGTLVAYPEEGVVPGWVSFQTPMDNPFLKQLQQISQHKRVYIALGVSGLDSSVGKHYNALVLLSPDAPPQFYRKRRLVPFGEYIPYGLGTGLSWVLSHFGVEYAAMFEQGQDERPVQAGRTKLGALVCFELIDAAPFVSGYSNLYKAKGVQMLLNVSNLGWFHQNRWLEAQFLAIAQMRAAENRLPLVIASNTGISAVLSPLGKILAHTNPLRQDEHKTQILFYNGKERMIFTMPRKSDF